MPDSSKNDAWLYSFFSVLIISVCGLVPIVCMPRLQKTRYQNDLLQFLIGLAIGTLTADALLHLLPVSHRARNINNFNNITNPLNLTIDRQLHNHQINNSNSPTALTTISNLSKHFTDIDNIPPSRPSINNETQGLGSTVSSLYNSTIENFDHHSSEKEVDHDHHHEQLQHNNSGADDTHHHHHSNVDVWFGMMALIGIIGFLILERCMVLVTDTLSHQGHVQASTDSEEAEPRETQVNNINNNSINQSLQDPHIHIHHEHQHQNHHQHQHHHLTSKTQSFMFMIITGDGLHNFFDGIAIGVSYNSSIAVGLGTSIAILCHELPHEIGDFAVLIKNGMSIRRAVLYNTLSSALCLLGALTGVYIGRIDISWVSALIAGMFLYISLVDMVPQLNCFPNKPVSVRVKKLIVQIAGILLGVLIMSMIALYEDNLHSFITTYNGHN